MRRSLRNPGLAGDRRGAVAVEFALVGLVILSALLALFETGRMTLAQSALQFATGSAARWASVHSATATQSTVSSQFQAAFQTALPGASASVSVTFSPSPAAAGGAVTVAASYAWVPVSGALTFAARTLSAQVATTIQH
ncbi:MAG: pilus assembly protein [Rhodospirillales bacterium]|nr:pilus assembly protein [Rhodospirillales bacterium]MDE2198896.1 pilus assembly protein [Rhodospirillales bacterium]MDE2576125.1 pilus assembly protein [Rhodospirillales bacterium]